MSLSCPEMHFSIDVISAPIHDPSEKFPRFNWSLPFVFNIQHSAHRPLDMLCLACLSSPILWVPWGQGAHLPQHCGIGRELKQFDKHLPNWISWCDILIGHMLKLLSWFSPWTFLLPLSSPSQKRALHLPYFELSSSLAWWQQEPPVGLPTSKPVQGELCLLSFPLSFSFSFSMWICFILVYLQPGFPFSFSSDYVLTSIAV